MTTSYRLVGMGNPGSLFFNPNSSIAHVLGRAAPINRGYGGSTSQLNPYVIPWTLTTDTWGCAYPAGLVGVIGSFTQGSVGTFSSIIDSFFAANCVPVPGVLPVGYTPRWERDTFVVLSPATNGAARVDQASTGYRGPDGLITSLWVPVTAAFARGYSKAVQFDGIITGPGWPANLGDYWAHGKITGGKITGCRGSKYIYRYTTSAPVFAHAWTGSLVITWSHNADGTTPTTDNGDTIDSTHSFTFGDFTQTGPVAGVYTFTGPEIDSGAFNYTTGVVTNEVVKISPGTPFGGFGSGWPDGTSLSATAFSIKMSPNVSVPFQFSASGDGGLIAPGGTVI